MVHFFTFLLGGVDKETRRQCRARFGGNWMFQSDGTSAAAMSRDSLYYIIFHSLSPTLDLVEETGEQLLLLLDILSGGA